MNQLEHWVRSIDALLCQWQASFSMLTYASPCNAIEEQERLLRCWSCGEYDSPRWAYPALNRKSLDESMLSLKQAESFLSKNLAYFGMWGELYYNKIAEIFSEIEVLRSIGCRSMKWARQHRFANYINLIGYDEPDQLAAQWIQCPSPEDALKQIPTDDPSHPFSLLSRMRAALEHERIKMSIVISPRVGSLAATGNDVIVIAANQKTTAIEIERIVLHEIHGHVLPRTRSQNCVPALLHIGSAWANEDEEGRALMLEKQAGLLHSKRKRSLAARHIAACMNEKGVSYVDVATHLYRTHEFSLHDSLAIASRVFRGGFRQGRDVFSGLAREQIYLPALLRIQSLIHNGAMTLDASGQHRISFQSLG